MGTAVLTIKNILVKVLNLLKEIVNMTKEPVDRPWFLKSEIGNR